MDATLGDAVEGDFLIRLFCLDCKKCKTYDPSSIAAVLGEHVTVPSLAKRGKCKSCGSRQAQVQVAIRDFNLMPVHTFGANDGPGNEAQALHAGAD